MNKIEYLLVCLTEECAEIIKDTDKALRFGLNDSHPCEKGTNHERIENEINDLLGVFELLHESGIEFKVDIKKIDKKKEKVLKYMNYAIEKGILVGKI